MAEFYTRAFRIARTENLAIRPSTRASLPELAEPAAPILRYFHKHVSHSDLQS
jgi:hypothetical protein